VPETTERVVAVDCLRISAASFVTSTVAVRKTVSCAKNAKKKK
jgi:hypothetical protein